MVGVPCADLRDRHLVIGSDVCLCRCSAHWAGEALFRGFTCNNIKMLDSPPGATFMTMVKSTIEIEDGLLIHRTCLLRTWMPGNLVLGSGFVCKSSIEGSASGASPTRAVTQPTGAETAISTHVRQTICQRCHHDNVCSSKCVPKLVLIHLSSAVTIEKSVTIFVYRTAIRADRFRGASVIVSERPSTVRDEATSSRAPASIKSLMEYGSCSTLVCSLL